MHCHVRTFLGKVGMGIEKHADGCEDRMLAHIFDFVRNIPPFSSKPRNARVRSPGAPLPPLNEATAVGTIGGPYPYSPHRCPFWGGRASIRSVCAGHGAVQHVAIRSGGCHCVLEHWAFMCRAGAKWVEITMPYNMTQARQNRPRPGTRGRGVYCQAGNLFLSPSFSAGCRGLRPGRLRPLPAHCY